MDFEFQNIKEAVDSILKIDSIVAVKPIKGPDKKRDVFIKLITSLEETIVRSTIMYADCNLDMSQFEEKYWVIIDILIQNYYGQEAWELISYYLWDRYDEEGNLRPTVDANGTEINLSSAYDLWELVIQLNPKIK